jgi:Ca-activated chloride channel family protein
VSFAAPTVLLALLALPVLALLYGRRLASNRAAAAAFVKPRMRRSVAPRRPGWRRHVPIAIFALALAVLVAAAAKPERTVAVPVERASIMLMTDVSGSMQATDVTPNRLTAAKRAANRFVAKVPAAVNVGVMAFNGTPRVLQSPTRERDSVYAAIERMTPSGGTATGDAIATSVNVLKHVPGDGGRRPPAAILLLSDGASQTGRSPQLAAEEAKRLKIPIYTVALGTQAGTIQVPQRGGGTKTQRVPPDPRALAEIARTSGGQTFSAATSAGLSNVYEKLGSQLSHHDEKRQVTSAFAGGGLVLLLAGAVASLAWFGRPI